LIVSVLLFGVSWSQPGEGRLSPVKPCPSLRSLTTSFSGNHQKLLDFAFRAVHVTAISAKEITRAYYGRPLRRAYFEGCSTGGRQGLILAQRFPDDFDGIVAGAPILNETGQRISSRSPSAMT
jgi:pimeloyl-ACP methyl ester carboxylesterase